MDKLLIVQCPQDIIGTRSKFRELAEQLKPYIMKYCTDVFICATHDLLWHFNYVDTTISVAEVIATLRKEFPDLHIDTDDHATIFYTE